MNAQHPLCCLLKRCADTDQTFLVAGEYGDSGFLEAFHPVESIEFAGHVRRAVGNVRICGWQLAETALPEFCTVYVNDCADRATQCVDCCVRHRFRGGLNRPTAPDNIAADVAIRDQRVMSLISGR